LLDEDNNNKNRLKNYCADRENVTLFYCLVRLFVCSVIVQSQ